MPIIKTEEFNWVGAAVTPKPTRVHKLGHGTVDPGDEPHKRCTKCQDELPATTEFFYADHTRKDGLTKWCCACQIEWRYGRHAGQL